MRKPRRYTGEDILRALAEAGIEESRRQIVLEILDSKPPGRPLEDDARWLEKVVELVLNEHLRPFTAAMRISPDRRTAKRIHRKYMADREAIEANYQHRLQKLMDSIRNRGRVAGGLPDEDHPSSKP